MSENQIETDLNLGLLQTPALGLVWGLTSSVAKDGAGNPLLARLSNVFEEAYAVRTGKLGFVGDTAHEFDFDFEQYCVDDLKKAVLHFCALTAAFEQNGRQSSAKFCKQLLSCMSNALDAHAGAGHA